MDKLVKPFVEAVAERLVGMLEAGVAPWQTPWRAGEAAPRLPNNPTTGNRYRGINALHLMAQGYEDPRWMTYKQGESVGAQVRRGERGTPIQFWKFSEQRTRQDEDGRALLDERGQPQKYTIKLERPALFMATVFNASQMDGVPAMVALAPSWNPLARAERVLRSSGARLEHGVTDRACYLPIRDIIHLPARESFARADDYYATALHELGHWTGHSSRLDRDLSHPFGSDGYAREELRAEIASMLVGEELAIGHDPAQHAAYVGSWIKVVRGDPLEIFRAAADAERILDFVLEQERKLALSPADLWSTDMERLDGMAPILSEAEGQVAEHMRTFRKDGSFQRLDSFHAASREAFGFELPPTWDGRVNVVESREGGTDGPPTRKEWTLLAVSREASRYPLASYADKADADHVLGRLALVDALSEHNEFDKAAKLARIREAAVRRDQASRPEDIAAAREARKSAELQATQNDNDLMRRVAEKGGVAHGPGPEPERIEDGQHGARIPSQRQYLAVPRGERSPPKAAKASRERAAKVGYADGGTQTAKIARWLPVRAGAGQGTEMAPRDEFAEALRAAGCVVDGPHPLMDGKLHRIAMQGERSGENAGEGFYVGHLGGHPAGFIKNHQMGVEVRWKAKGYVLSQEDKAALVAQAASKMRERSRQRVEAQEAAAERVALLVAGLRPARDPTAYMRAKSVEPARGALTDGQGVRTYLPATDANGKLWTVQIIQADGAKRFPKGSRTSGCFHVVGGLDGLSVAPVLLIAVGYATASSLSRAGGFATVAAFDPDNLPAVAKALHEKFPDKPVVVAGDHDLLLTSTRGAKLAREWEEEAARAVGGRVLRPVFGAGEREADPQSFKDFNDLASRSHLGEEGVARQLRSVVEQELYKVHSQRAVQLPDDSLRRRHVRVA